ncbi:AAA family ATPase [Brevundimonas sp. 2R-24]|uniref:AAA family ATPase n=1 Tax=Peiella sedimenti TaxID=3061083 RepID=A0ABT8SK81_9CAUL|nr:AAA family ATPase [Caulobacteraceae bacterium XZ-24]
MTHAFGAHPADFDPELDDLDLDFPAPGQRAAFDPPAPEPEAELTPQALTTVPAAAQPSEPLRFAAPAPAFNPVADLTQHVSQAFQEVSVPRIGIHIFGERPDTLAAAERAGQDRRLSRATTQIRVGGLSAALEAYAHEPTPPLVIVESAAPAGQLLADLDRLAENCDMGTKVVVIGAANDIMLYRELMRRGVSEYLVAPIQPLQLIGAIGSLFNDPAQPFVGRTMAFIGARGGSGSSTVAHNTAWAIAERLSANTLIVDYDLPFGTAGLDFNQDPLNGVADALSQPDRLDATLIDRMMVRCTDRLSLFAAPATLDADWDISADAYEEVTGRIRGAAPFVVLDLPHAWSAWVRRALVTADDVVITAAPDLASLRNAKNIIDLIRQARPNDAAPKVVLNQVGMPGRPEIPAKDFGAALGVHPALLVPFDAKIFGAAANNGQMVMEAASKSKAAEAFTTLAQIVSQRELAMLPAPGKAKAAKPGKAEKADKPAKSSLLGGLFKKR